MNPNATSTEEPLPDKEGLETAKPGKVSQDSTRVAHIEHFENEDASHHKARTTRLLRKIDLHLLPFISILYLLAFLDRVNIANAKSFNLVEDLGLGGTEYNTILVIFFVPYVFFEIPSNILLKKLSPRVWLSVCGIAFGLVTVFQGLTQNYSGILATRFFLGVFECGMFP